MGMRIRPLRAAVAASFLATMLVHPLSAQHAELPRQHTPEPTTAGITVRDVMTRTYIIADDSMEGRDTGRRGGLRAAEYIARQLQTLGLEPAGDNGTYFQGIPWMSRRPDPDAVLRAGEATLVAGTDFLLLPRLGAQVFLGGQPYGGSFHGQSVPTVYGGRIGATDLLDPAAAADKLVVFDAPADPSGRPLFAFWQRNSLTQYAQARAIAVTSLDAGAPGNLRGPRDAYWDSTGTGAAVLTVLAITSSAAERIFGAPVASLTAGDAGSPITGDVSFLSSPTEAPAYNVIGILRGRNAKLRNEYVAVGAHYDHVGFTARPLDHDSVRAFNSIVRPRGADDPPRRGTEEEWVRVRAVLDSLRRVHPMRLDSINNGADDDGSGSVLSLEIAEAFAGAARRPARSLLFVFHTAEEKGLYGAQFFSDHPTVPRDSIVAQVNMDQMGRGEPDDAPPGGPNALVVIGSRRLSTELGDLAERVNQRPGHRFHFDYEFDRDGDPTNAYCRSDHYMYARYGIPVAFFSAAAWHRDYHMVTDEPQYIAYDRMARIGRYIPGFRAGRRRPGAPAPGGQAEAGPARHLPAVDTLAASPMAGRQPVGLPGRSPVIISCRRESNTVLASSCAPATGHCGGSFAPAALGFASPRASGLWLGWRPEGSPGASAGPLRPAMSGGQPAARAVCPLARATPAPALQVRVRAASPGHRTAGGCGAIGEPRRRLS